MKPTKREQTVHNIKNLAKEYGVRLYFNGRTDSLGQARFWTRSISVNKDLTPRQMLSVFFHELGHIYCHEVGKWAGYHNPKSPDEMTDQEKTIVIKTALKAERWVDNWARQEMTKHFPGVKYYTNYGDKSVAENFLTSIKKELNA
jgi:hypothetical protein